MKHQEFFRQVVGCTVMVLLGVACTAPAASTPTPAAILPQPIAASSTPMPKPTALSPTVVRTAQVATATSVLAPATTAATLQPTTPPREFALMISGKPNALDKPIGVAVNTTGDIYVVDTGNSRVQKFDRNGNFLLMWGTHGSGAGQFDFTMPDEGRVALDASGNVYVVDVDNYRIQKFDPDGKFLLKWGTQGDGSGQFKEISDIAIDSQGDVYVLDYRNDALQVFDSGGHFLRSWGSPGSLPGNLNEPSSVAIDGQGHVWIAELTGQLQEFNRDGRLLSKVSLPPVAKAFIDLWNIAFDSQGNLYVADRSNYRIVKLDPNGETLAVWGNRGDGEGQFMGLQDITVDKAGQVYVSDAANNCVQVFR